MLKLSKEYLNKDINGFTLIDVKELQKIIKYHSKLYYNNENPIISDTEYDELFKKLSVLEKKYNIKIKETSFIGAKLSESSFEKVKHSRPMISLDNTYNDTDLLKFNERVIKNINDNNIEKLEYILEFKFDGLGVELIYKKGKLIQAITRGNGIEGEDVTINVMQIENIPKIISYKKHLEIRGEVVMPISVFNNINEKAKKEGTKIFSNPRNSASGSLRMKNSLITKERKLQFFAYDLASFGDFINDEKITEYFYVIKKLEKLGFNISSYFVKHNNIKEVLKSIKNFGDIKKTIDFEIDGLVLKVNNISLWQKIGFTEHHPKYAISYKFPAEIFTTKILSVDHQIGKTGTITPVANLDPINMGGAIIRRATLHNYEEIESLGVKIGDNVFIKRAGEVIPKIISVIDDGNRKEYKNIFPPKYCPSCKTEIKKDQNKTRYYCPNDANCPAINHEKITFAVGKQGFNIDGFGIKQVETFLKEGIISNIVDVFKISEKKEEILKLEGFQEKSIDNLIKGINTAKNVNISTFITALGISGVGKKTSKVLSRLFKTESDLSNFSISENKIEELSDIGPEISKNIITFFNNDTHKKIISELIKILNIKYYKDIYLNENSFFGGKNICITGGFELNGEKISRDFLVDKLEKEGGNFIGTVSKKLDYLLAGNKAGTKLKKANELGIKIIDLDYFYKKIKTLK